MVETDNLPANSSSTIMIIHASIPKVAYLGWKAGRPVGGPEKGDNWSFVMVLSSGRLTHDEA